MSIVQEIMIRNTDYLRRIIAPAEGARRRYDVTLVPALQQFPYIWRVSGGKKAHNLVVCVVCEIWIEIRLEATQLASGRTNRC